MIKPLCNHFNFLETIFENFFSFNLTQCLISKFSKKLPLIHCKIGYHDEISLSGKGLAETKAKLMLLQIPVSFKNLQTSVD